MLGGVSCRFCKVFGKLFNLKLGGAAVDAAPNCPQKNPKHYNQPLL